MRNSEKGMISMYERQIKSDRFNNPFMMKIDDEGKLKIRILLPSGRSSICQGGYAPCNCCREEYVMVVSRRLANSTLEELPDGSRWVVAPVKFFPEYVESCIIEYIRYLLGDPTFEFVPEKKSRKRK